MCLYVPPGTKPVRFRGRIAWKVLQVLRGEVRLTGQYFVGWEGCFEASRLPVRTSGLARTVDDGIHFLATLRSARLWLRDAGFYNNHVLARIRVYGRGYVVRYSGKWHLGVADSATLEKVWLPRHLASQAKGLGRRYPFTQFSIEGD